MPTRIKDWRQGIELNIYRMGGVKSGGVCLAMCAHWMTMQDRGASFWPWMDTAKGKIAVIKMQAHPEYQDVCMAHLRANFKQLWSIAEPTSFDNMLYAMMMERGNFKLAVLERSRGKSGAHAVAIQTIPTFRFFDPNYGEWDFGNYGDADTWEEFAEFMLLHMRVTYRGFFDQATMHSFYTQHNHRRLRALIPQAT